MREFYDTNRSKNIARRNSALLGSDFLGRSQGGLSYDRVKYYFDVTSHQLELCSWSMMAQITRSIVSMRYLKTGSIDFEVLDSIEPNDILGVMGEEDQDIYEEEQDV